MLSFQRGFSAVGRHDHAGRIVQHAERILDRFVVRAADRDPFSAHPIAVAILAEKHAVPEALLHPGNLRRKMKNAGCEQEPRSSDKSCAARARTKPSFRRATLLISSVRELDLMQLRLSPRRA